MHSSLTSMIQALFFSLAAGYMVMRFENVWITVIAHFIVNLLSFITNTVMQLQPSAVYADFLQAVTGVVFLLFIGACIYSVIFHRQMFTSGYNLTDRPAARAFLLSPVALCFYIICVLAIVLNTFTTL